MEAIKKQTGHTAQSKTVKDLTAPDYQLNLHHDAVVKEQQKTFEANDTILQSLKKAVTDHEAKMAQQSVLDQEVLDHIKSLKEHTAAQLKQVTESTTPAPIPTPVTAAVDVILPPELSEMATALRSLLTQVTSVTLPTNAGEQQDHLAQLRLRMSSTLQPLLAAGTAHGPAAVTGDTVREEVAPYNTKEPAPGQKQGALS